MRIFTVIGARPQFIKAAPLSETLRKTHEEFLVHTGQHYDTYMSTVFFEELGIPEPDANLEAGGGTHAEQTANMIVPLESLMIAQDPDIVLIYGDTNSTLAGALASAKLNIPIAHVEAGLRSFNMTMPEEVNRILTDRVSSLLFCPTQTAAHNLRAEGITEGVLVTGDIMADAVFRNRDRGNKTLLDTLKFEPEIGYILTTIHRPTNADSKQRLTTIFDQFSQINQPVIFPLHPRTRKQMIAFNLAPPTNVHLIDPLGYSDLLFLLNHADICITDSGGLQKEAYLLNTACVTVRPQTEWTETIDSGWNTLAEPDQISDKVNDMRALKSSHPHPEFYGDGKANVKMMNAMEAFVQRL